MDSKCSVRMDVVVPVCNCVTNRLEFSFVCRVSRLCTLKVRPPKGNDSGLPILSLLG